MKINLLIIFTLFAASINAQNRMDEPLPIITKKAAH